MVHDMSVQGHQGIAFRVIFYKFYHLITKFVLHVLEHSVEASRLI